MGEKLDLGWRSHCAPDARRTKSVFTVSKKAVLISSGRPTWLKISSLWCHNGLALQPRELHIEVTDVFAKLYSDLGHASGLLALGSWFLIRGPCFLDSSTPVHLYSLPLARVSYSLFHGLLVPGSWNPDSWFPGSWSLGLWVPGSRSLVFGPWVLVPLFIALRNKWFQSGKSWENVFVSWLLQNRKTSKLVGSEY